ncbi:unnamed protein product [Tuber aestivum]|uniref:Uncharacterized protein n=1 Tax=Tuber aestivum TaxID=59557 RepID=A0A292Q1L1_9PEZI|nr:unnamed protein product [Tuber aestivum]
MEETPSSQMAPPNSSESPSLGGLGDNGFSTPSASTSCSRPPPPSVRRSGRHLEKVPVYYGPEKRRRRQVNTNTPAKKQRLSGTDPLDSLGENTPAPIKQTTLDNEPSPPPNNKGIPRFTPTQIRIFVRYNSKFTWRSRKTPRPSLPTDSVNMSVSRPHLKALVRAAASHYQSLPRKFGDPKNCFLHLYKTFLPTVEFEEWEKESGGTLGERDTHIVLMKVFEIVFTSRYRRGRAREKIWGLLGFRDEEDEENEENEEGGEGAHQGEASGH